MDRWSIVRSLRHRKEDGNVGHSNGDQICFTGYPAGANADENVMPSIGSLVAQQQQELCPELPAYVMIPRMVPGTGAAWLGAAHNPFETQADPANPGSFQVRNFALTAGLTPERLAARRKLLGPLDRLSGAGSLAAMDSFQQRRSTLSLRAKRRRYLTWIASRRPFANNTACSRRSTRWIPSDAARRIGLSECCLRGDWSRRACGWSPSIAGGGTFTSTVSIPSGAGSCPAGTRRRSTDSTGAQARQDNEETQPKSPDFGRARLGLSKWTGGIMVGRMIGELHNDIGGAAHRRNHLATSC